MKKIFNLTILALLISFASFAQGPISGPTSGCIGLTYTLTDTVPGGTWSSSTPAVATIHPTTGDVTPLSVGVTTITYVMGGTVTQTFTVTGTAPAAITGTTSFCVSSTTTLASTTPGGIWTSSNPSVATVGSSSGIVSGITAGTSTINYSTGCSVSAPVYVSAGPAVMLAGPRTVCVGSTIALSDSLGGTGTWASSNPSIATVSSGVVTGVSAGTVIISFSSTGACGTTVGTLSITVTSGTSAGTISGASSVMAGSTTGLSETVSGGTWSSSNTSIATINASTGVVTGVAAGSVTISYTVTGCSGPATATYAFTVTAFNGISGDVLFTSGAYYGPVRVWLINYDPSTMNLTAVDSTVVYSSGTSVYYQFLGMGTDSFRVKAAVDSTSGTTGYIPTYHTADFYWYNATVINHVAGTGDINKDITMAFGTPTTGPGFIGGNVTTGANKGTSTAIPAVGLAVYVINTTTNTIIQQTKTDASGNYSFSNLPVGQTYKVFPEAMNYLTTSYNSINLTTAAPSLTAASFIQHTVSKTITPIYAGVGQVNTGNTSITAYPNPTNGKLNIQWETTATEKATISVTDVTGREVFKSNINMTSGNGAAQADLSALTNGMYIISVKSASVNYNSKIQVQH